MSEKNTDTLDWFEVSRVKNGWIVRLSPNGVYGNAGDMMVFTDRRALGLWAVNAIAQPGQQLYDVLGISGSYK